MQVLQISKKDLEVFGSNSLSGLIAKKFNNVFPKEIRIEFEQTSMGWRAEHNGCEEIVIPEFSPMCLAADLVHLISVEGMKIEIGEYNSVV